MTRPDELTRLLRRGATLTRRLARSKERHEELARERAEVWQSALAHGASGHAVARAAGIHHSQVAKAIERYGSNGQ